MRDDWQALLSALASIRGPETTAREVAALAWKGEPTHRQLILAGMALRFHGWTMSRPGHKARVRTYARPSNQAHAA